MFKEKILPISIFCLSISIIISAIIIANGINIYGNYVSSGLANMSQGLTNIGSSFYSANSNNLVSETNTYDLTAASTYLGISEYSLIELVNTKDSGIPFIKIGSDYIFSKNALDKWMETVRVEIK